MAAASRAGTFKLLTILTDKNVPRLLDLGYDITAPSIFGIAGPAGIPDEVVKKLQAAIEKATKTAQLLTLNDKLAMQMNCLDSSAFEKSVFTNYETQGQIIREAGLGK